MAVSVNEMETKYEASANTVLPDLGSLRSVAATTGPQEQVLAAEYYDTADLRLIRAGVTLRRRTGGSDAGWHLKLPAGPRTREEIQLPLRGAARQVPAELADLVRGRSRGGGLRPVATITTRRQVITLVDENGVSLAEVADDDVSARDLATDAAAQRWREIEVELTGGTPDLLTAADELLLKAGLRRSGRSAKLERVLDSRLPEPAAGTSLTSAAPAIIVVADYLRRQAEVLNSLDPMVRRFAPDAVHQMRVATRRLRSALRSFGQVIDRAASQEIADELKWLGTVLGEARDAEVQAERLRRRVLALSPEVLLGPVLERVQVHAEAAGARASRKVSAALRSKRYLRLLDDLDALVEDPPPGATANSPADVILPQEVCGSFRKTRRRVRRARRASAGQAMDTALHQARKAAKQARYAAEVAAPVVGKSAERFARRAKKLQSVLGDHQDTVVGRQLIRQLGVAAHRDGESAFSYGVLYGAEACDALRLEAQAWRVWRKAARPRRLGWMSGAS